MVQRVINWNIVAAIQRAAIWECSATVGGSGRDSQLNELTLTLKRGVLSSNSGNGAICAIFGIYIYI